MLADEKLELGNLVKVADDVHNIIVLEGGNDVVKAVEEVGSDEKRRTDGCGDPPGRGPTVLGGAECLVAVRSPTLATAESEQGVLHLAVWALMLGEFRRCAGNRIEGNVK